MDYTQESLTAEICKIISNGDHGYIARLFNGKVQLVETNDDNSELVIGLVVVEYGSLHNGFNLVLQTGELHNIHFINFDLGSKMTMQMHAHRYGKNKGQVPDMQHWAVERIKQKVVELNAVLKLLEPHVGNNISEPEELQEAIAGCRKLFSIPYTVDYALGALPQDEDEVKDDIVEDEHYFFGVSSIDEEDEDDEEFDAETDDAEYEDESKEEDDVLDEEDEEDEEEEMDDEQKFLIDEKTDLLLQLPSNALSRMAEYFGISDGGTIGLRRRHLLINELATQPRAELKRAFQESGSSCWQKPTIDLESNPFQI